MKIELKPIAFVKNDRQIAEDDDWGSVISEVTLIDELSEESLKEIETFSHLEILFFFHKINHEEIVYDSRYPRSNTNWPKVGIFAQRGRLRPNRIGLCSVELIERKGKTIFVKGLDAINGTPVLDIKPVMKEFLPKGTIEQPDWSKELMKKYW